MPLVTDRDENIIRSVLDRLKGMVGYEDDIDRLYKVVAGSVSNRGDFRYRQGVNALSACEIAVAFIRLSEDLKQSHRNLRAEPNPEPTEEPKRDPRVDSLEAQVSANKSRIEELEKQFASLVGIVSVRALENLSQED